MQGLHALFTGEDDTWEAWLAVDASGISSVVSLGNNGIKLRRGYAPSQSKKPTQVTLITSNCYSISKLCTPFIPLPLMTFPLIFLLLLKPFVNRIRLGFGYQTSSILGLLVLKEFAILYKMTKISELFVK